MLKPATIGKVEERLPAKPPSAFGRIFKYTLNRGLTLSAALVFGIFLAVVVTNFGGFVDNIYLDRIKGFLYATSMDMIDQGIPLEERIVRLDDLRWQLEEDMGLHTPFLNRCIRWTADAITFGFSEVFSGYKSANVRVLEETRVIDTILDELPGSLILFGSAMLPAFFLSVWTALYISRKPGNWFDRLMLSLTPVSSVPSWVYGVILTTIFAIKLLILPERGFVSPTTDMTKIEYFGSVGLHLILPAASILLTSFFQSVYSWRTYFLLHADEDYVDLAVAKGLPPRMLERKYILRPTMPMIITNFSLLVLGFWQEIIALEVWFEWPGIGKLFIEAVTSVNSAVTMTIVVIFAYLFVILVFLLDIIYAIIDPRVRFGDSQQNQNTPWRRARASRIRPAIWGKQRRTSLRTTLIGLTAVSLGVALGLWLGWGIWQGDAYNATPADLHPDYQTDYMQLVIDSYTFRPESGLATNRIAALGENAPGTLQRLVLETSDPDAMQKLQLFAQNYSKENAPATPIAAEESPGLNQQQVAILGVLLVLALLFGALWAVTQATSASRPKLQARRPLLLLQERWQDFRRRLNPTLVELKKYPSAVTGLTVIAVMLGIGLITLLTIPQKEVIELWRSHSRGSDRIPKFAPPAWTNWFRQENLPLNQSVSSLAEVGTKTLSPTSGEGQDIIIELPLEYAYTTFPQDVSIFVYAKYEDKKPYITVNWIAPDGRETKLISEVVTSNYQVRLSGYIKDTRQQDIVSAARGKTPMEFLFGDPAAEEPTAQKGTYTLRIEGITFEEQSNIDAEIVLIGQVYGVAGTDHFSRNLGLAVGWGILVALAFGLIGAVITSLLTMLIAAIGAWFGGWIDNLIQRVTEVNMMIPALPLAITVYFVYAKTIWAILGAVVLLSIFGKEIKTYRPVFLQIKEEVYIEAAQGYGASNWRIITRYLIPRIIPLMVPRLVVLVPGYVFLEATLAFLGAPDEYLPTLGKVIYEAFSYDALKYHLYWVLIPLVVLILLGVSFAMFGLALDRILNPRIRNA